MELIINADGFGHSKSINKAITASFQQGLISSTTIMANMPGFEDACRLIKKHNLAGKIGIHLNLTQGKPLTGPIKKQPLFLLKKENSREKEKLSFTSTKHKNRRFYKSLTPKSTNS